MILTLYFTVEKVYNNRAVKTWQQFYRRRLKEAAYMTIKKFIRILPNVLTCLRIAGALALLFIQPFSPAFFIVYSCCGLTDVLDGLIARLAKCTSELGSKLDSIADLTFYAAMLLRIFPELLRSLNLGLWCWLGAIILLRIVAYIISACKHHKFASLHTYWNKATGILVFLVPYMIKTNFFLWYAAFSCAVATLAVADELRIHCSRRSEKPRQTEPV